ncbi:MAG: hypothetical protein JWN34_846 [Bryobacterales bacterium]|nr:hypothetical protein [Bryobacterales bacterium]
MAELKYGQRDGRLMRTACVGANRLTPVKLNDIFNREEPLSFSPCRGIPSRLAAAAIFVFSSAAVIQAQTPAAAFTAASGNALVKQYCAGCHSTKMRSGNLALQGLDLAKIDEDAGLWEKVLRKTAAKQMPPQGMPHPAPAAEKQFLSFLETELDKAASAHPNPGRPTIHRLNRAEYSNAIRDLFALDAKAGNTLPVDDTGYGFDNIGDVLSLSPVLIERYMTASRLVARLAVGNTEIKPEVNIFELPRGGGRGGPVRPEAISEDLPFGSGGGLSFSYTFPVDADYVFKIKLPAPAVGFGETAIPVGEVLELKIPVKAGIRHVGLTFMRSSAVPETLPTLGGGRGGGGAAAGGRGPAPVLPMAHLDLRLDGARLKLWDVPETANGPRFNELSIGGPYDVKPQSESASRKAIFGICKPGGPKEEDACARQILKTLARRAYRRPVTEAELKPLMTFYATGKKEKNFEYGIETALRAMLVSPEFLFRVERDQPGAAAGAIHRVNDFELASRLSFFLWSSIPDEELLKIAEQGKLKDPAVVEQQVARMLDDPKSKAFVSNFSGQWLFLRNLDQMKPDPDVFPKFDAGLRKAFQQETELFFNSILRENRPVSEFLDAKYTFLNQKLADFYGVKGVYGPQFRRVELTDTRRGGLLGQGSILTVTSYPNRTSVVQRGKWILENLLGTPPPAPPPNVPSLETHGKEGHLTMRQAMELHRANPVCASCHAKMDPLGFALENYDGIGAWRDKDGEAAIDPSGTLPDGSAFSGGAGLRKALLEHHRDEFVSTLTEKLMIYALGRGLEPYDRPVMRSIMREAARKNTTIPALINAIVQSPQFQMRRNRES